MVIFIQIALYWNVAKPGTYLRVNKKQKILKQSKPIFLLTGFPIMNLSGSYPDKKWMLEIMDLEGIQCDRHIGFSPWLAFVQPCQLNLTSVLVAPFRDCTDLPPHSLSININVQFGYHSDAALIIEIFHASYFLPFAIYELRLKETKT